MTLQEAIEVGAKIIRRASSPEKEIRIVEGGFKLANRDQFNDYPMTIEDMNALDWEYALIEWISEIDGDDDDETDNSTWRL